MARLDCISQHNTELNVQISTLSYSERELMDANGRLRESLERVREELRSTRTHMEKTQQEAERYETESEGCSDTVQSHKDVRGCIFVGLEEHTVFSRIRRLIHGS